MSMMGEIKRIGDTSEIEKLSSGSDLVELTDKMLLEARSTINSNNTLSVPITELSTLGAGVASLVPELTSVTQTTTINTEGLYQLANRSVGDALKAAKDGNFWASFKTADGGSKFVKLKEAGPISTTKITTVAKINPATMMMAVALFSIEKKLGQIADMQKQIISFLAAEKEAEIEADIETLMGIATKYKLNWDNERFISNNHKLALDIQRTSRKNIGIYQKKVNEMLGTRQFIVAQNKINATHASLQKDLQYYRLSLYTFSLASMIEVLLSGNFKEEYIAGVKDEIERMSDIYRRLFSNCSVKLEKMGNSALEVNVVKGLGTAGNIVGKIIGSIPLVKKGPVDELLQDTGNHLQHNAVGMEKKAVKEFANMCNPGTRVFIEKMEDMIQIYNHTTKICFDKENIYLL